jgi:hypothetical protein
MGPIIFLKMAENKSGSYDATFGPSLSGQFFNFTQIINNSSN